MSRPAVSRVAGSGLLWLAAGACGGDGSTPPVGPDMPDPDTVVDSIWVAPTERTIGVLGTEFDVGAAALAADGTILYSSTKEPERFTWSSSAPDVAMLGTALHAPTGNHLPRVTGMGEGTATITATSGGLTGRMTVTVRDRARHDWSAPVGPGATSSGIAIGADGTIYVGADDPATDISLWSAVSPEGDLLWSLPVPLTPQSTPAIGHDGTLYLGSRTHSEDIDSAGRLIAVHPVGTVRWMVEGINGIRSAPALGPDGNVYVAGGRNVYAIGPEGEIQWAWEREERVFFLSSPAVGSDGTIYVGGEDHFLYALNPDGTLRWTFQTQDRIRSSPAIGPDGTIYFGSGRDDEGRLFAINPDGTVRWRSASLDFRGISSSPSIGPDGTIYVGGYGVYAINPDGSTRWHFPGSQVMTTPILGADGTVYVAAAGGVTALDAQGELSWNYTAGGHTNGSPALGIDGTILVASYAESSSGGWETTLQALIENGSTNGGYPGSPWPTERGDRSNTGRAGG